MTATANDPKPDPQVARLVATALAAGLKSFKVVKRGRELTLEVTGESDPEADDLAARIDRMNSDES